MEVVLNHPDTNIILLSIVKLHSQGKIFTITCTNFCGNHIWDMIVCIVGCIYEQAVESIVKMRYITTAVKRLNRYFCFSLLGFHLPVSEKWVKVYKSVSQHNYLSIFLKILSFFR